MTSHSSISSASSDMDQFTAAANQALFLKQPSPRSMPPHALNPPSNTFSSTAPEKEETSMLSVDIIVYQHISSIRNHKALVGQIFSFPLRG
jgi:hypothetical protein